jgi:hypothetical protein
MGFDFADQHRAALERGKTLLTWRGSGRFSYRLRRVRCGHGHGWRHVVERRETPGALEWRRMTYAQDVVDKLAELAKLGPLARP